MRRQVQAILFCALLTSCGQSKPELFPDYCEEQKRQIPTKERYRAVLLDILKNKEEYDAKFGPNGVHFFVYRDAYLSDDSDISDAEIADSYVTKFPDCCRITLPEYYLTMTARSAEDLYDVYQTGDWVKDVYVKRNIPADSGVSNIEFYRIVSDCGEWIRRRGDYI